MGKLLLPAEKAAVISSLERKSSREAMKHLVSLSSNPHVLTSKGTLRSLGQGHSELRLVVTDELAGDLTRIKGLLAHAHPDADWPEVIERMVEVTLQKIDPLERAKRAKLAKEKRAQRKGSCLKTSQRRKSGAGREGSLEQSESRREEIDRETGEVQICLPLPTSQPTPTTPSSHLPPAVETARRREVPAEEPTPCRERPAGEPASRRKMPAEETTRSRKIPAATTHEVWFRDRGSVRTSTKMDIAARHATRLSVIIKWHSPPAVGMMPPTSGSTVVCIMRSMLITRSAVRRWRA